MNEEVNKSESVEEVESNTDVKSSKDTYPPWLKKIGKLMIFFIILGCVFMSLGAMLLNSVIDNALSGHGL